ncbi:hypothetical protein Mtc_0521 [Methanocella conradii HZ254]|uniref:Uncharacterized protein n=1 Tax=Methanocella conradii (strain DSM 24694 / JCM 17849 / CGMCC 1.5162 / HZ254) TaxID=1041930 RepID=H8I590_METCZ|nr:hypothetical protein [Methanocella conradii]AFC99287.1 hypothetical protein Mtc_0521 [Methanocella conradii HZ254]
MTKRIVTILFFYMLLGVTGIPEAFATEDKAITIASAQFDNISVARADATLNVIYTPDEKQKVAWIVDVLGEPKDDIMEEV